VITMKIKTRKHDQNKIMMFAAVFAVAILATGAFMFIQNNDNNGNIEIDDATTGSMYVETSAFVGHNFNLGLIFPLDFQVDFVDPVLAFGSYGLNLSFTPIGNGMSVHSIYIEVTGVPSYSGWEEVHELSTSSLLIKINIYDELELSPTYSSTIYSGDKIPIACANNGTHFAYLISTSPSGWTFSYPFAIAPFVSVPTEYTLTYEYYDDHSGPIYATATITVLPVYTITDLDVCIDVPRTYYPKQYVDDFSSGQWVAYLSWPDDPFPIYKAGYFYTVTVTIVPNPGYTLIGVPSDSFTVNENPCVHAADTGTFSYQFVATDDMFTFSISGQSAPVYEGESKIVTFTVTADSPINGTLFFDIFDIPAGVSALGKGYLGSGIQFVDGIGQFSISVSDDVPEGKYLMGFEIMGGYLATFDLKVLVLEHTVYFDSNGGSYVPPQTVKHGEKAIRPPNPTQENRTFWDWITVSDFYDFDKPVTSDIRLKAVWNYANVDTIYVKLFLGQEFTHYFHEATEFFKLFHICDDDECENSDFSIQDGGTIYDDYGFFTMIWKVSGSSNETGVWEVWNEGGVFLFIRIEVVDHWTITFDSNGGSYVPSQDIFTNGGYADAPVSPSLYGYAFRGWVDGSNVPFNFYTTPITSDLTLYATWEEGYTENVSLIALKGHEIEHVFGWDYLQSLSGPVITIISGGDLGISLSPFDFDGAFYHTKIIGTPTDTGTFRFTIGIEQWDYVIFDVTIIVYDPYIADTTLVSGDYFEFAPTWDVPLVFGPDWFFIFDHDWIDFIDDWPLPWFYFGTAPDIDVPTVFTLEAQTASIDSGGPIMWILQYHITYDIVVMPKLVFTTLPTANLSIEPSNKDGMTFKFDLSGSKDFDHISLDLGDGTIISDVLSYTHTYKDEGEYVVTVTATNGLGSSVKTQKITVTELGGDSEDDDDKTPVLFWVIVAILLIIGFALFGIGHRIAGIILIGLSAVILFGLICIGSGFILGIGGI